MAYEEKPNRGAMFKNKAKVEGDRRPNYNGHVLVSKPGKNFISVWKETSKNGVNYWSVSLTHEDDVPQKGESRPIKKTVDEDLDFNDEVPGFGRRTEETF